MDDMEVPRPLAFSEKTKRDIVIAHVLVPIGPLRHSGDSVVPQSMHTYLLSSTLGFYDRVSLGRKDQDTCETKHFITHTHTFFLGLAFSPSPVPPLPALPLTALVGPTTVIPSPVEELLLGIGFGVSGRSPGLMPRTPGR